MHTNHYYQKPFHLRASMMPQPSFADLAVHSPVPEPTFGQTPEPKRIDVSPLAQFIALIQVIGEKWAAFVERMRQEIAEAKSQMQ